MLLNLSAYSRLCSNICQLLLEILALPNVIEIRKIKTGAQFLDVVCPDRYDDDFKQWSRPETLRSGLFVNKLSTIPLTIAADSDRTLFIVASALGEYQCYW